MADIFCRFLNGWEIIRHNEGSIHSKISLNNKSLARALPRVGAAFQCGAHNGFPLSQVGSGRAQWSYRFPDRWRQLPFFVEHEFIQRAASTRSVSSSGCSQSASEGSNAWSVWSWLLFPFLVLSLCRYFVFIFTPFDLRQGKPKEKWTVPLTQNNWNLSKSMHQCKYYAKSIHEGWKYPTKYVKFVRYSPSNSDPTHKCLPNTPSR